MKRMRWKALKFLGRLESSGKEKFGFTSRKCPPVVDELMKFESDLILIIKNIEFRNTSNTFQEKLRNDIKELSQENKVFVSADKSIIIYKMDKESYEQLLFENVTKTYKKSTEQKLKTINKDAKRIAEKLEIDDRIEKMKETQTYITVKDHKEDFPHKISCRLINPSKSDIGKISKIILDRINQKLVTSTSANQWKNTQSVIDWYVNIPNKKHSTFVVFDIESFYPSISLELFNKTITFASRKCDITEDELNIIMQSRKTLFFHDNHPWVKKNGEEDFDVPMGCNDGAEICETTGCYILRQLGSIINQNSCGLYRDDGLGTFENLSGPQIESKCKQIIKLFKSFGLNITIKTNFTSVDFLDVRLNLKDGTYEPYREPNSNPLYIHKNSNHPPNIIRHIPKSISKRLSDISCNQEVFEKAIPLYENALKHSGFDTSLQYVKKTSQT